MATLRIDEIEKTIDIRLSITPYEILNSVYSFLTEVRVPTFDGAEEIMEELKENLSENYGCANFILGDGLGVTVTEREEQLASVFYEMGVQMGAALDTYPVAEIAEEEIKKAKQPSIKGGKHSRYEQHEAVILSVIKEYLSLDNAYKKQVDKMTQIKAIEEIEMRIDCSGDIGESTFRGWLNKYKKNKGEYIFNEPQ